MNKLLADSNKVRATLVLGIGIYLFRFFLGNGEIWRIKVGIEEIGLHQRIIIWRQNEV